MNTKDKSGHFAFEPRKSQSVLNLSTKFSELELDDIKGILGTEELLFRNGKWITNSLVQINSEYRVPDNEIQFINSINKSLKEENNLLELKVNVLIQMFSKMSAEVEMSHTEYKELKNLWYKPARSN